MNDRYNQTIAEVAEILRQFAEMQMQRDSASTQETATETEEVFEYDVDDADFDDFDDEEQPEQVSVQQSEDSVYPQPEPVQTQQEPVQQVFTPEPMPSPVEPKQVHQEPVKQVNETPISHEDVRKIFTDTEKAEPLKSEQFARDLDSFEEQMRILTDSVDAFIHREQAARSKTTEAQANSPIMFKKNTVSDINGNPYEITQAIGDANFGDEFYSKLSDTNMYNNLDLLREAIMKEVVRYFGGFNRIHELYVVDDRVIINGVAYIPRLKNMKAHINKFPLDMIKYIEEGCIAPLFWWDCLFNMTELRTLYFQSVQFANTYVSSDMGWSKFDIACLFRKLKNLSRIRLGNETIERDDPHKESETDKGKTAYQKANELIDRAARFKEMCGGANFSFSGITDKITNYSVDSLKTYATNRGNIGFLRFGIGVLARSAGVVGVGAVNIVTHIASGIRKSIVEAIQEGAKKN